MAVLGNLIVNLRANSSKYIDQMERARKSTRGFQSQTLALKSAMRGFAVQALAAAGVAGIGATIKSSLDALDTIQKLNRQLGASTEFLSEMSFAMEQSGGSIDDLSKGMTRLQKSLGDARNGLSTATRAFEQLGLNFEQLLRLNPDEQFLVVADAISKLENDALRTQVAMDIFGRSGSKLNVLFKEGAEGIEALRASSRQLGKSFSVEQVQAAADAKDALNRVRTSAMALRDAIVVDLAPALEGLANFYTGALSRASGFVSDAFEGVRTAVRASAIAALEAFASLGRLGSLIPGVGDRFARLAHGASEMSIVLQNQIADAWKPATAAATEHKFALGQVRASVDRTIVAMKTLKDEIEFVADAYDKLPGRIQSVSTANAKMADEIARANQIVERTRTPLEAMQQGIIEANALFEKGRLSADAYGRRVMQLQDDYQAAIDRGDKFASTTGGLKETIADTNRTLDNLSGTITQELTSALQSGELSLNSFAAAALRVLQSMINTGDGLNGFLQILGSIGGSLFGGGGQSPIGGPISAIPVAGGPIPRARGGRVMAGRAYMVGEEGPEPFIPGQTGTVLPNDSLGANVTVNLGDTYIDARGAGAGVEAKLAVWGDHIQRSTLAAVRQEIRRGGPLASLTGRR